MNCAWGILRQGLRVSIAIFCNMTQRQGARYRVACYVIVNNITTATLESKMKNAWKRRWQKRNWNSLNKLYLGVSDSFKDSSSKLNNHSAMAVGKFIFALSVQFEFCLILWLFSLRFCMKTIWNWIIKIDSWFFFRFLEIWMKKPTCTFSYGGRRRAHFPTPAIRFFSFIPQGNEKNQLSVLKKNGPVFFIISSINQIHYRVWK